MSTSSRLFFPRHPGHFALVWAPGVLPLRMAAEDGLELIMREDAELQLPGLPDEGRDIELGLLLATAVSAVDVSDTTE